MKTKFTKRIIQIISIICIFSCLCSSVSAYTTTTSGKETISPSKSQFKKAKNPMYDSKSKTISDSIKNKYEMDIVHYEAQKNGYYAIYTTGNTDTVGKVYEEENFLWWTTEYNVKGATKDDTGVDLNYRHVLNLDKHEDYYICTRAYNTKTGNYKLVIEPNDDARKSNIGGRWINDSMTFEEKNTEVYSKTYLTVEQVAIYYAMLCRMELDMSLRNAYTENGPVGVIQDLVEMGYATINLFTIGDSFSVDPIVGPVTSLILSISEGAADMMFQSLYEDTKTIAQIRAKLNEYGGADHDGGYGVLIGCYATQGVCITTKCTKTVIDNPFLGRRVTTYSYSNSYSTYNSTELVGEQYEKGYWI